MYGELFGPIFVPKRFREALGDRAWLQAMLDAEAALAVGEARAGLISAGAAKAISSRCDADRFDPAEIGHRARDYGNPVPPLVKALTAAVAEVSGDAARHVHRGATSQDITDTAAMLLTRRVLDLILEELDGVAAACARLAEEHRGTLMAARTLMQQALPTTFGLKAAGWLVSVVEAGERLRDVRGSALAAQLGGAAGTLASLGGSGVRVLAEFARELGLAEPAVPWHTDRTRISEVAGALSLVAG
ncbi:MAG: lyase family protein, partial [Actinomycetota bacterium]